MNKRKFINASEKLLKESKRIVKEDKDKKYVWKVTLVNLMLERKITADEISQMSGVPRRTLSRQVKDIDEKGFEPLRNIKVNPQDYRQSKRKN